MEETEKTVVSQKSKAQLVSACMLQQSMFTFAGVGVGLALGLQRRNLRPFVYCVTAGTLSDAINAYMFVCRSVIEDYKAAVQKKQK